MRAPIRAALGCQPRTDRGCYDPDTDMPDPAVLSCIVGAYRALRFPESEGGIVTSVVRSLFSSD